MTLKIMEQVERASYEARQARKIFEELNSDIGTQTFRADDLSDVRELFGQILDKLDTLERFFSYGDKILPEEELKRLMEEVEADE